MGGVDPRAGAVLARGRVDESVKGAEAEEKDMKTSIDLSTLGRRLASESGTLSLMDDLGAWPPGAGRS